MSRVSPPLIEFRQYVIAPGGRGRMIELFDRYFAHAQDELGLPILGHFRVTGDPDRLVWLRGFSDMASRPEKLGAFYGGPVWAEHGAEAIALVKAYDNVQLLREAEPGSGIGADPDARTATAVARPILATTYRLAASPDEAFVAKCRAILAPLNPLGLYVSDPAPNNFPPLPIREGQHLLTWFAYDTGTLPDEATIESAFAAAPERLRLEACATSLLR